MGRALSALPQLRVCVLMLGVSCCAILGALSVYVCDCVCMHCHRKIESVLAQEPQPPALSHDGFLTVELEDKHPRPAETFMKPYDPLLYLMYPNRPLWLLSILASP